MVGRRVYTNAHWAIKWCPCEYGDARAGDEPELSEIAQMRRLLVSDPRDLTDCADWQFGKHVVDVGCGAGIDSLIAARIVGPDGQGIGVDMTPAMLGKARHNGIAAGLANIAFREGYAEALPVYSEWADVVISNGVLNLFPDKLAGLHR